MVSKIVYLFWLFFGISLLCILYVFIICNSPRYIGEGTSGKVFHSDTTDKVIKIMKIQRQQKQFANIQQILQKIDPKREVFGGKIVPPLNKMSTKKLAKFHMMNDGISLEEWMMKTYKSWQQSGDSLFLSFFHLLTGFEKLNNAGYVHGDVKLPNIVVKKKHKKYILKMIDYDFMNTNEFVFSDKILSSNRIYFVWPPELQNTSPLKWLNFTTKNQYLLFLLHKYYIYEEFMKKYNEWYTSMITTYTPIEIREQFSKFDVYGLGIVALQLFYPVFKKYPAISQIIYNMMDPDPHNRYTITQATDEWKKFLQTMTIKRPI